MDKCIDTVIEAVVRDITYENIRIQHYYDKLINFRVMRSMYNKDKERGQIRNIRLKIFISMKERYGMATSWIFT